jgi:hypothetical protein
VNVSSLSSRAEEFHLRALPEPCMNLSIHTAPYVRPPPSCQPPARTSRTAAFLRTSAITPPKPFSRLGLTVKAGNVLLHTTWKSNDDMSSGADFERLRVKGNLIGGFWHFANMSRYDCLIQTEPTTL